MEFERRWKRVFRGGARTCVCVWGGEGGLEVGRVGVCN